MTANGSPAPGAHHRRRQIALRQPAAAQLLHQLHRDRVAEHVHRGAAHVHERIHPGDDGDRLHRQPDRRQHRGQRDQPAGRHVGNALAGDHRGDDDGQLRRPGELQVVGLGQERHRQRDVERAAVEVEAVAERQHDRDDLVGHAHPLQRLDMDRQRDFGRPRGEPQQHRLDHAARDGQRVFAQQRQHHPEAPAP